MTVLRVPFICYYKFRNQQLVIWETPKFFFSNEHTSAILKNACRALGQISDIGILFINHGPECLYEPLVNKLFGDSDTFELEDLHSFNGEVGRNIEEL